MKFLHRLLVSLGLMLWSGAVLAQDPTGLPPGGFADLVEKLSPAVVNISTTQKIKTAGGGLQMYGMPFQELPNTPEFEPFRDFFERFGQQGQPREREVHSLGSGFVIDASGYVITNNHVIDQAEEIMVIFNDNSKFTAKIIGRDKKVDLALLKIESKKPLPFVSMGDSDAMRVGDWVIAIGNPFGLGGSVTQGIISARQRSINAGPFDDFLQTDAPINRGNSGGPLFNTRGEVIGINSAIFSPSGGSVGIGFAIPTALAKPIIAQLKEFGRTHRGWLGVKIQEVSDEVADSLGLSKSAGALVIEVTKGSPAEKAGIEPGDVITAFDGKEISEMRFLPRRVADAKIGKPVSVSYWRKGAAKTATVTIGEQEEEADGAAKPDAPKSGKEKNKRQGSLSVIGIELSELTPMLRNELRLDDKAQGVVVLDVDANSEAAQRGVRPGDRLLDVSGVKTNTPAQFKAAFDAAAKAGRKFALVRVARGDEEAFVTLPLSAK